MTESHVAWELNRAIPEIPSPLHHRGRIYLIRNGGLLASADAKTGELVYRKRLEGATGQFSASPVVAGGHLYLLSNRGRLSVVKEGDAFETVQQVDLGEPAFVTPAIDRTTLYVRTQDHLWAFRSEGGTEQ